MLVLKGRYARNALPHNFNIDVFKCDKNKFYNEFKIKIDSCGVTFDSNDCWNLP